MNFCVFVFKHFINYGKIKEFELSYYILKYPTKVYWSLSRSALRQLQPGNKNKKGEMQDVERQDPASLLEKSSTMIGVGLPPLHPVAIKVLGKNHGFGSIE